MSWIRLSIVTVAMSLSGCASQNAAVHKDSTYLARSVTQAAGGVVVTASVLDQNEIVEVFAARLNQVGIQPVWLRVNNLSAYSYVLFLRSIDPDYFSPYEVARRSAAISEQSVKELYPLVRDREIDRFITPGKDVEGYVYTHLDEGLKVINVAMLGNEKRQTFHMAVEVPGLPVDFDEADFGFDQRSLQSLDENELRSWLEALPCCTRSADDSDGDPLNLVLVGDLDAVRTALVGQHWDVTAKTTSSSVWRIVRAFIFGSRYRYAPVSPLYMFGREQDMSFQKARAVIDERNHIRLWRAPIDFKGTPVWVGHISRDAGVKFSGRLWPPTTHVIDPAVDEARFYLEQDIVDSQKVERIGLVDGVGEATTDAPRLNAEGDPYFTDGLRAVFFLGDRQVPLDAIEVLPWRLPAEVEPFRDSIFLPDRQE